MNVIEPMRWGRVETRSLTNQTAAAETRGGMKISPLNPCGCWWLIHCNGGGVIYVGCSTAEILINIFNKYLKKLKTDKLKMLTVNNWADIHYLNISNFNHRFGRSLTSHANYSTNTFQNFLFFSNISFSSIYANDNVHNVPLNEQ